MLVTDPKRSRYQRKCRELGRCGYAGCKVETGDDAYYCLSHKLIHAKRMRAHRKAKTAARRAARKAALA